jgi:hemoglobin/transferrin/lactoferrin receptor protein
VVWRLDPIFSPYAQWAKGFRAPTPDQVNNGFFNPIQNYGSLGNPHLKAERANSLELGVRGKVNGWRYALAAFNNSYQDFITQATVSGTGAPGSPKIYQYINLAKANIKGLEARSEWTITPRWTATAGLAYSKGDSWTNGVKSPLDTINPLKTVAGLRYDSGALTAKATISHSKAKAPERTVPLSNPADSAFAPGSYTVLDLGLTWKPQTNFSINANINNLFDQKYWRWSDVRGLGASSTVKDAYTAAGRHFSVSLRYDF